jgi:hypothetical protein
MAEQDILGSERGGGEAGDWGQGVEITQNNVCTYKYMNKEKKILGKWHTLNCSIK